MSVAVEFEKPNTESHPHTNREVQKISINPDNNFEEFEIIIDHEPSESQTSGLYYLCFMAGADSE